MYRRHNLYNLAADMGGIGYITAFRADIARNNILSNAHMPDASRSNKVARFLGKPQGVRGRKSDNTRVKRVLGWESSSKLEDGLKATYKWIESELRKSGRVAGRKFAVA